MQRDRRVALVQRGRRVALVQRGRRVALVQRGRRVALVLPVTGYVRVAKISRVIRTVH